MNRETKQLVDVVIQIIDSGLGAKYENPYFFLFDANGNRWEKFPEQMSPQDIRKFIRARYGSQLAQCIAEAPQLTLH
jgi:hypothetical protein